MRTPEARDGLQPGSTVILDDHLYTVFSIDKQYCVLERSEMSNVTNPNHYQNSLGIEVIGIIREYFADNYNLGNVLKYLLRADKKNDRQEDLEKALQYLTWEVERGR